MPARLRFAHPRCEVCKPSCSVGLLNYEWRVALLHPLSSEKGHIVNSDEYSGGTPANHANAAASPRGQEGLQRNREWKYSFSWRGQSDGGEREIQTRGLHNKLVTVLVRGRPRDGTRGSQYGRPAWSGYC